MAMAQWHSWWRWWLGGPSVALCSAVQVSDQPRVSFVAEPAFYTTTAGDEIDAGVTRLQQIFLDVVLYLAYETSD